MQQHNIPTAADIMSRQVISFRTAEDMNAAMERMLQGGISGGPVVDDAGCLLGMLTQKDCLTFLLNVRFYGGTLEKVHALMSRDVRYVLPASDIFAIAGVFAQGTFRTLPVVQDEGLQVIGVVSRGDVLRAGWRIWDADADLPPDPGYLTPEIKAKLGRDGTPHLRHDVHLR